MYINTVLLYVKSKPHKINILCTSQIAGTSTFGWGCSIGLSAVIIPKLRDPISGLGLDDSGASWIGSCLPLGAIIGSMLPGRYLFKDFDF